MSYQFIFGTLAFPAGKLEAWKEAQVDPAEVDLEEWREHLQALAADGSPVFDLLEPAPAHEALRTAGVTLAARPGAPDTLELRGSTEDDDTQALTTAVVAAFVRAKDFGATGTLSLLLGSVPFTDGLDSSQVVLEEGEAELHPLEQEEVDALLDAHFPGGPGDAGPPAPAAAPAPVALPPLGLRVLPRKEADRLVNLDTSPPRSAYAPFPDCEELWMSPSGRVVAMLKSTGADGRMAFLDDAGQVRDVEGLPVFRRAGTSRFVRVRPDGGAFVLPVSAEGRTTFYEVELPSGRVVERLTSEGLSSILYVAGGGVLLEEQGGLAWRVPTSEGPWREQARLPLPFRRGVAGFGGRVALIRVEHDRGVVVGLHGARMALLHAPDFRLPDEGVPEAYEDRLYWSTDTKLREVMGIPEAYRAVFGTPLRALGLS